MSWKPYFEFKGGEWATNAQAFATKEEALRSAAERYVRWTMPIGYEARESDEPVNYFHDEALGDQMVNREPVTQAGVTSHIERSGAGGNLAVPA